MQSLPLDNQLETEHVAELADRDALSLVNLNMGSPLPTGTGTG